MNVVSNHCRGLALCLGLGTILNCSVGYGDVPAENQVEESLLQSAQETYELLLNEYRLGEATGPLHLELLNTWSKRIFVAQTQAAPVPGLPRFGALKTGHEKHVQRMVELEQIVGTLKSQGKVTGAEVAAARFFRLEGRILLGQLNALGEMSEQHELDVTMPVSGEAQPLLSKAKEVLIQISQDGRYFLSGKEVNTPELEKQMRRLSLANPGDVSVVISAHPRSEHRDVVLLMNLCKRIGVDDYSVTMSSDPTARN